MTVGKSEGKFIHSEGAWDKRSVPSVATLRGAVRNAARGMLVAGIEASMAKGYQAMAKLNLALAAEGHETLADWPAYEEGVSEAGPSGDP